MELFEPYSKFPTAYDDVLQRVTNIDPVKYGSTRNYINGSVTHLSPYISRGVISTKFILSEVIKRGYAPPQIEKFIQELAWRDHWQMVWISNGEKINEDLRQVQKGISNTSISKAIVNANTGILAIDESIVEFYKTGYLHNHLRMYIASIACNVGRSAWKMPAKWMYYHLLDADWASNALSWQWVVGANSNKKYYANQENINKYCFTHQKETFLDVPYASFDNLDIPDVFNETVELELETPLPTQKVVEINKELPTLVYNSYNLDPQWRSEVLANRILLLEPSHFEKYPVSKKTIDFILQLAADNITNVQVYIGEFDELMTGFTMKEVYYKEHPLSNHYEGIEDPRDWMFDVKGEFSSFFSFWKKCKKQMNF